MQATPWTSSPVAGDFVSWLNRAIASQRQGRSEEALSAYRQALTCNPRSDFAFACLGDVLNSLGRHEEALVASRCAADLNPACALAYFSQSEALMSLQRYQEALGSCERAVALTGSEAAYAVKADVLTELQRYHEALKTYAWALRLNPACAAIYNNLGLLLVRMQRYREAQRSFERALALEPGEALFAANLSQLRHELQEAGEVAQAPGDAQGTALGEGALDQGRWEDMETVYMRSPRLFRSVDDWL